MVKPSGGLGLWFREVSSGNRGGVIEFTEVSAVVAVWGWLRAGFGSGLGLRLAGWYGLGWAVGVY